MIDKPTYAKYEACVDSVLLPVFQRSLHRNPTAKRDSQFGFLEAVDGYCPLLDQDRLCSIQLRLGEEYLSRTCATYPRVLNNVDDVVERSLYLSCPEAARLALLNPEPMQFVEIEEPEPYRFTDFPEMSSAESDVSGKPYQHAAMVRGFVRSLLQDRAYPLWERLVILGSFCEQLDRLARNGDGDAAPDLVKSYSEHIAARLFADSLAELAALPGVHLDFVTKIVEDRIATDATGSRFLECYADFRAGIGWAPGESREALAQRYSLAQKGPYEAFRAVHGYMLEHFVVSNTHRGLFPFGPQRGLSADNRSIFDDYVHLVMQYALVRSLLVGMAGHYKSDFSPVHAIKLIQSFAKSFEHHVPFLKRVRQSLADSKMDSMAVLAVLVKD